MAPAGWHPEDIKATIRKRGITLTQLSLDSGLAESTVRQALHAPCFAGEQAIVAFLGIEGRVLWPDRYDPDGTPRHPQARARHLTAAGGAGERQIRGAA